MFISQHNQIKLASKEYLFVIEIIPVHLTPNAPVFPKMLTGPVFP